MVLDSGCAGLSWRRLLHSSFGQAFILVFHDGIQGFDECGKGPLGYSTQPR